MSKTFFSRNGKWCIYKSHLFIIGLVLIIGTVSFISRYVLIQKKTTNSRADEPKMFIGRISTTDLSTTLKTVLPDRELTKDEYNKIKIRFTVNSYPECEVYDEQNYSLNGPLTSLMFSPLVNTSDGVSHGCLPQKKYDCSLVAYIPESVYSSNTTDKGTFVTKTLFTAKTSCQLDKEYVFQGNAVTSNLKPSQEVSDLLYDPPYLIKVNIINEVFLNSLPPEQENEQITLTAGYHSLTIPDLNCSIGVTEINRSDLSSDISTTITSNPIDCYGKGVAIEKQMNTLKDEYFACMISYGLVNGNDVSNRKLLYSFPCKATADKTYINHIGFKVFHDPKTKDFVNWCVENNGYVCDGYWLPVFDYGGGFTSCTYLSKAYGYLGNNDLAAVINGSMVTDNNDRLNAITTDSTPYGFRGQACCATPCKKNTLAYDCNEIRKYGTMYKTDEECSKSGCKNCLTCNAWVIRKNYTPNRTDIIYQKSLCVQ